MKRGGACLVADNGCNGAFVHGEAARDWRGYDLAAHRMRLAINGKPSGEGTGAAVRGHPCAALTWLANRLSARGRALAAGEFVSTGTCCGIHYLRAGDEAVADYGSLGSVGVRITA